MSNLPNTRPVLIQDARCIHGGWLFPPSQCAICDRAICGQRAGKHQRETVFTDATPTGARCTCAQQRTACPRHEAITYADAYALHATDSIGRA